MHSTIGERDSVLRSILLSGYLNRDGRIDKSNEIKLKQTTAHTAPDGLILNEFLEYLENDLDHWRRVY